MSMYIHVLERDHVHINQPRISFDEYISTIEVMSPVHGIFKSIYPKTIIEEMIIFHDLMINDDGEICINDEESYFEMLQDLCPTFLRIEGGKL